MDSHFNELPDTSRSNTRQTRYSFRYRDYGHKTVREGCAHGGKLAERDFIAWGGGEDADGR